MAGFLPFIESPDMATFGRARITRSLVRLRITLATTLLAALLIALLVFAVRDVLTTARMKDEHAQRASLSAEVSDFNLATRTENNESLFADPPQFSAANRPLRITILRKPFFTYLLHSGNARTVSASTIDWEVPEACMTRFPGQPGAVATSKYVLEGCLAATRSDPNGRFVYFAFRYPSDPIVRHRQGQKPTSASYVLLNFYGGQESSVYLVFETPPLAEKRFPSQLFRFNGLHEVTGYASDGSLIRSVNAQAYERQQWVDGVETNLVTVVGRIDASKAGVSIGGEWPTPEVSQVRAGVVIGQSIGPGLPAKEVFSLSAEASGVARISVEQAYSANVRSRSDVQVWPSGKLIWASQNMRNADSRSGESWFQTMATYRARVLVTTLAEDRPVPIRIQQSFGPNKQ